jgi:hypothetical protein
MAVAENGSRRDLKQFRVADFDTVPVQIQITQRKADDPGQAQSRTVSEDEYGI